MVYDFKYQYKDGFILPVDAQTAGEECGRLESEGRLTPENLVDASRPEDAPLHDCFEWDDGVAAEKYRNSQAAYVIRSIEVRVSKSKPMVRAFVPVSTGGKKRTYKNINAVLRKADTREALLEQARKELLQFKAKYESLSELAAVFKAMDGVFDLPKIPAKAS